MTLTNFRPLPDPERPVRRPLTQAARNLCRIKTEQLAREMARKEQAARETEVWSEGDDSGRS